MRTEPDWMVYNALLGCAQMAQIWTRGLEVGRTL